MREGRRITRILTVVTLLAISFSVSKAFLLPPRVPLVIGLQSRHRDDYYDDTDDAYYRSSRGRIRDESAQNNDYWNYYKNLAEEEEEDYDANDNELQRDVLEWESVTVDDDNAQVQILLPPPTVQRPAAILHFCGGTLFGSAPALCYRQLLEELVEHTSVAVVATPLPLLPLQSSPLNHVRVARNLQRQFGVVWRDVLCDEYGQAVLQDVPVCGLGHSLGARLLVVMATLAESTHSSRSIRYKANVLMSFTNYGAAAGIPGISQLSKSSRRVERQRREQQREQSDTRRRRRRDDDWDMYDDDDDEEWGEIFQDLQDSLKEQAFQLQSALTPSSEKLEFFPSPEQLWTALTVHRRYQIPQTLLVQFDDDEMDQSAKIAAAISNTSAVKFARLRGTHLTPIISSSSATSRPHARRRGAGMLQSMHSGVGRVLTELLRRRRKSGVVEDDEASLRNLRQAIARYITEVVTKEEVEEKPKSFTRRKEE